MFAIRKLSSFLPLETRRQIKVLRWRGNARYCPICEHHFSMFLEAGFREKRIDAKCPVCGSIERHRLAWHFLTQKLSLLDGEPKRILHFAPENSLQQRFRQIQNLQYVTADLDNPYITVKIDITAIGFASSSFDGIYCSHVLEHVPDDAAALREMKRLLKPGGWAVLQVPIKGETTSEDLTITDPQERLRLYGQEDHVRWYGNDFIDRVKAAGFEAEELTGKDVLSEENIVRFGVKQENLYYCR
jgi:SAM-dependent methyltransferase